MTSVSTVPAAIAADVIVAELAAALAAGGFTFSNSPGVGLLIHRRTSQAPARLIADNLIRVTFGDVRPGLV